MPAASSTKPSARSSAASSGPAHSRAAATHHDQKVVRDGFTMPQDDYDTLKSLKAECLKRGIEVKKSELLRAGVQALAALPPGKLVERIRALPPVKAGRKKKKD